MLGTKLGRPAGEYRVGTNAVQLLQMMTGYWISQGVYIAAKLIARAGLLHRKGLAQVLRDFVGGARSAGQYCGKPFQALPLLDNPPVDNSGQGGVEYAQGGDLLYGGNPPIGIPVFQSR